jgi:hypothetical protein
VIYPYPRFLASIGRVSINGTLPFSYGDFGQEEVEERRFTTSHRPYNHNQLIST